MSIILKTDGTAEVQQQNTQQTTPAMAKDDGSTKVNTSTAAAAGDTTAAQASGDTNTVKPNTTVKGLTTEGSGVDFSALTEEYAGKYDAQLADLYNQITQRKPFSYNSNDDMLYQMYVDRYQKGGQMAMEDTMAQAAGLTGGYGNTYAQRVGQQTYDEYMTGLNDKALELEQRAYGRYQDEGDRMMQQYGMLGDLADTDYGRYMDRYNKAAANYDRYMQEAALLGSSGYFDIYGNMFGDDAKNRMQQIWAAQNLMPLYQAGQMDAETYKSIAGVYPVGYNPNPVVSGGGDGWGWQRRASAMAAKGSSSGSSGGSGKNASYTQGDIQALMRAGQSTSQIVNTMQSAGIPSTNDVMLDIRDTYK